MKSENKLLSCICKLCIYIIVIIKTRTKTFFFRDELEVIFSIENRTVESTHTTYSSQSNPLKLKLQKKSCAVGAPPRADENNDDLPDPALSPVKPCNSRPIPRPSSSRSLVAVQDEEDVRLHWARTVRRENLRELIKENEERSIKIYIVKNKKKDNTRVFILFA
jgi:hypothetical protein